MSFQKISGSTGKGTIRFYEATDSLFNEVKLLTTMRSRTIKDETGKTEFDEYSVTDSERDFFNNFLKYAVPEIFSNLAKIATGVVNSVFIDEGSTNSETGFSLIDNEAYDDNILTIIDGRIRECYILYCLKKWWLHTAFDNIQAMYTAQYMEALREMKKMAYQLIKPLMV